MQLTLAQKIEAEKEDVVALVYSRDQVSGILSYQYIKLPLLALPILESHIKTGKEEVKAEDYRGVRLTWGYGEPSEELKKEMMEKYK